ncbi:hypothetical protein EJB05_28847 [Eragrostis curvula]|uniref:Ubiquitin-like domain-containing protein n=1 Tax=Eragrostis curvula TaxID=38414 RepID=A0A5J9USJ8_9POAL|nr:hypothetical protein EJB05_28847 [Eragrostis curvula]
MGGGESDAGGESGALGSELATLRIRWTNGSKFAVRADLSTTVAALKAIVAESSSVPAPQQRLIYKGRILMDERTLASYGVETDHTIQMVCGAAPRARPPPISIPPVDINDTDTTPPTPLPPSDGLGGLLQGGRATGTLISGGLGLFVSGLPELDQMQRQLAENPNLMPLVQNLLNSPDLIRNIVMNNPQMRELIDQNPDLGHVLNDPSILRQTVEAARNPELMREMMRNTDRAMSNIESFPEGFNMLRRMYETVEEQFLNARTTGSEGDRSLDEFAAFLGNQGSNQARDPAANAPTAASNSTSVSPSPNTNPLPNPWSTNGSSTEGAARSFPASNTRSATPTTGGPAGLGSANLRSMLGDGNAASFLSQVLQNPTMMQVMQTIMANPQSMNQLLNIDLNVRNMMASNTQLREMFQNPEFLRQFTSPETLQQLISLQQSLGPLMSQLGQQQSGQERNQGGAGAGNVNLNTLMSMFSWLGTGGLLGVPNVSNVPPEELYAAQLAQLQEMGFFDTQENLRALIATAGNVHAAVERLLGNLGR